MSNTAFMGEMWSDSSLQTSTLKKEQTRRKSKILVAREKQIMMERMAFIKKKHLADEIMAEFPRTNLPLSKIKFISLPDLLHIREKKRMGKRRDIAVRMI